MNLNSKTDRVDVREVFVINFNMLPSSTPTLAEGREVIHRVELT
jgi:hypothetical protein